MAYNNNSYGGFNRGYSGGGCKRAAGRNGNRYRCRPKHHGQSGDHQP